MERKVQAAPREAALAILQARTCLKNEDVSTCQPTYTQIPQPLHRPYPKHESDAGLLYPEDGRDLNETSSASNR